MGNHATPGIGEKTGFQGLHNSLPDLYRHICAWCAYQFKRHLLHKEQDCLKKRRYLDKAVADTAPATVCCLFTCANVLISPTASSPWLPIVQVPTYPATYGQRGA